MDLLLILAVLFVILAVFGGLALSPLLWLLIIVAVAVALFSRVGPYHRHY